MASAGTEGVTWAKACIARGRQLRVGPACSDAQHTAACGTPCDDTELCTLRWDVTYEGPSSRWHMAWNMERCVLRHVRMPVCPSLRSHLPSSTDFALFLTR